MEHSKDKLIKKVQTKHHCVLFHEINKEQLKGYSVYFFVMTPDGWNVYDHYFFLPIEFEKANRLFNLWSTGYDLPDYRSRDITELWID